MKLPDLEQSKSAVLNSLTWRSSQRSYDHHPSDCGLLSRDLAAGIRRVKGVKKHGIRIGDWLTAEQGKRHLAAFNDGDFRGKRDYAMAAVLLG